MRIQRRYPIGAEIIPGKGVHFRVWAPNHDNVVLVIEEDPLKNPKPIYYPMRQEKENYFSKLVSEAGAGTLYRYQLSKSSTLYADPASHFQPQGPDGPSCVIDPDYPWSDQDWPGITLKEGQILYEMHIGTFTQEGTFQTAMKQLEELADLGVTILEIMPLNDFPGHFGWGYDGVNLYAPSRVYGKPKDVKAFINKAHKLGLGVILDVVYNHLGPESNHMAQFSKEYLTDKYTTDWGDAINFDLKPSREYFLTNAKYWIEEFHFDGLRIDATSCIFSSTTPHVLAELTQVVKEADKKRNKIVIGENEPQDSKFLRGYDEGGFAFDGLWNDDFHHSAYVRLTGKREAYYTDYLGSPQEFISSVKYGFLYQGQYYEWQEQPRGCPDLHVQPASLIIFLENHDQIANSGNGKRLHELSDPGNFKALTCLFLLSPNTPMLFQGQEYGSHRPFLYFSDHNEGISRLISKGRKESLAQFPRFATSEVRKMMQEPANPITFMRCKLDFREREENTEIYNLHKDLIKLRKKDPVFQNMQKVKIDGAVLGVDSFLIRYFGEDAGDRLLIINFGPDHYFNPAPEPLLVAGQGLDWEILWSSESTQYGGQGTPPINVPHWKILGHSAIALKTCQEKRK